MRGLVVRGAGTRELGMIDHTRAILNHRAIVYRPINHAPILLLFTTLHPSLHVQYINDTITSPTFLPIPLLFAQAYSEPIPCLRHPLSSVLLQSFPKLDLLASFKQLRLLTMQLKGVCSIPYSIEAVPIFPKGSAVSYFQLIILVDFPEKCACEVTLKRVPFGC